MPLTQILPGPKLILVGRSTHKTRSPRHNRPLSATVTNGRVYALPVAGVCVLGILSMQLFGTAMRPSAYSSRVWVFIAGVRALLSYQTWKLII